MTNQELCLALLKADTEAEVVALLMKAGYWDDPTVWRFYGDQPENWATVGNQQSRAEQALIDLRASVLPITIAYADAQAALSHHHGDPFDRMLVAQAVVEAIAVVSADRQFDAYGITRMW